MGHVSGSNEYVRTTREKGRPGSGKPESMLVYWPVSEETGHLCAREISDVIKLCFRKKNEATRRRRHRKQKMSSETTAMR